MAHVGTLRVRISSWCPTCGPARLCNCGTVEPPLREWLRANEQRTARVATPRLVEDQPDTFVLPIG